MTRTHPNRVARNFYLPNHSKQHTAFCGLSLHLGSSESRKTIEQKLSSKSALLIPTVSTNAFHSTDPLLFSRHYVPTNSVAPLSAYKPTRNSSNRSDERLMLETSTF